MDEIRPAAPLPLRNLPEGRVVEAAVEEDRRGRPAPLLRGCADRRMARERLSHALEFGVHEDQREHGAPIAAPGLQGPPGSA